MRNKILEVYEGWKNSIFKKVTIEEIADIRRSICVINKCGYYITKGLMIHCKECGCPIEKKIRSLRTSCPVNLWGSVNEMQLLITTSLFDRSNFYIDKVDGTIKHYRHKKFKDIVILFDTKDYRCTNGIVIFEFWKQIQDYFKERTGKNLN